MNLKFSNQNFIIFGLGKTGISAVLFCKKYNINFFIFDENKEILKNFNISEDKKIYNIENFNFTQIEYIFISPGIKIEDRNSLIYQLIHKYKLKTISDLDIFYEIKEKIYKNNKIFIGITGTNGKSTTTTLLAFVLNQLNKKAVAIGNIGMPVLEVNIEQYDYFIIECSSYQLNLTKDIIFDYATILNINKDHLEYHLTIKHYVESKSKILQNAKHTTIGLDDKYCIKISKKYKINNCFSCKKNLDIGLSFYKNVFYYNNIKIANNNNLNNLIGIHNKQNILCVLSIILSLTNNKYFNTNIIENNIENKIEFLQKYLKIIEQFKGLEHRMEIVKTMKNIVFINDSKATNADSTSVALKSFNKKDVIFLIAGGKRKEDGFIELKKTLKNKFNIIKKVFLIGESSDSFANELKTIHDNDVSKYDICNVLQAAVQSAYNFALNYINKDNNKNNNKKYIILLSPMSASFDQYKNFEERGNEFKKIVEKL